MEQQKNHFVLLNISIASNIKLLLGFIELSKVCRSTSATWFLSASISLSNARARLMDCEAFICNCRMLLRSSNRLCCTTRNTRYDQQRGSTDEIYHQRTPGKHWPWQDSILTSAASPLGKGWRFRRNSWSVGPNGGSSVWWSTDSSRRPWSFATTNSRNSNRARRPKVVGPDARKNPRRRKLIRGAHVSVVRKRKTANGEWRRPQAMDTGHQKMFF